MHFFLLVLHPGSHPGSRRSAPLRLRQPPVCPVLRRPPRRVFRRCCCRHACCLRNPPKIVPTLLLQLLPLSARIMFYVFLLVLYPWSSRRARYGAWRSGGVSWCLQLPGCSPRAGAAAWRSSRCGAGRGLARLAAAAAVRCEQIRRRHTVRATW
ncbi:unnamed protein product [Prorocentrum cordatum]|uniref:Uncharacterized protein n=1 Tax=Prorocentrum cordatum TaxID=2364126 RepID=A0ABN9Y0L8_9DINO|nr:unnamed protein product [Polarella glacialis]